MLGQAITWKKIGNGGFSEVYLSTYHGRAVAIKRFKNPKDIETTEFRKEFRVLS